MKKISRTRARRPLLLDLTAMTDIAFVLLACFITIDMWNMPKGFDVQMPRTRRCCDCDYTFGCRNPLTITLILDENNTIYSYNGLLSDESNITKLHNNQATRNLILSKIKAVKDADPSDDPIFFIKNTAKATYGNMVDLLDEMHITDANVYAFAEMTESDKEVLAAIKSKN